MHKCNISGCKTQVPRFEAICARHREMLPIDLRASISRLWEAHLLGSVNMISQPEFIRLLGQATAIVREREQRVLL